MNINPITKMDYPDPDIIRIDDTYYMVSTTMHYFPGGAILKSYNLVDWEIVSYVFDTLDDTPGERLEREQVNYGAGMWAPSFRYHDGRFYVCFNSHTGGAKTYLFTADNVEGPWKKTVMDEVFYDCSLFFDDDATPYILHGNGEICITELKKDLSGSKEGGLKRLLFSDEVSDGLKYEGTHIYKHDGYYYVFNINWPKGDIRTQWCHRGKTLNGDFEGRIVFHNTLDFETNGIAQGGIVDSVDGDWYAFLFEDAFAVGRIPVILPMRWEDGWPVIGENGSVPKTFKLPKTDKCVKEKLYTSDDFSYEYDENGEASLKKQWQWNHRPAENLWEILDEGGLQLTTGKISINITHTNNCLTQRMLFPKCCAKVTIDASGLKNGDTAGIVGLQSSYGYIAIAKASGNYYIVNAVRSVDELRYSSKATGDCMPGEAKEVFTVDGPIVTLCLGAEFGKDKDYLHFGYEKDGRIVEVGTPHKMVYRLDHFTGYRFGLFVYSTQSIGGNAVFKDFNYYPELIF